MKPEPDREIPQAQSAHDTFWDFASLQPESTHMLMWVMSDRAIPRSYRTMEGFGIHTFRLSSARGKTSLVKFHWKPGPPSTAWSGKRAKSSEASIRIFIAGICGTRSRPAPPPSSSWACR